MGIVDGSRYIEYSTNTSDYSKYEYTCEVNKSFTDYIAYSCQLLNYDYNMDGQAAKGSCPSLDENSTECKNVTYEYFYYHNRDEIYYFGAGNACYNMTAELPYIPSGSLCKIYLQYRLLSNRITYGYGVIVNITLSLASFM